MNDMELAILDLIKEVYHKEYVGGLKVTKKDNGYILRLFMGRPDTMPILIGADLSAEDFLKYVRKELLSRQLIKNHFYTGVKIYPEDVRERPCCEN